MIVAAGAVGSRLLFHDAAESCIRNGHRFELEGLLAEAEEEYVRAIGCNPSKGRAWAGIARMRWRTGRPAGAEQAYLKALELPGDGREEALIGLEWVMLAESRLTDLEKLAEHARSLRKSDVAREIAARWLEAGAREKLLEAESLLARDGLLRHGPGGPAELRAQAEKLPEQGPARAELEGFLSDAADLAERAHGEAARIKGPRGSLLQAELKVLQGKEQAAKGIAEELVTARDDRIAAAAMLMLARMAKHDGNADEALKWVGEAHARDPANAAARLELKSVRLVMRSFESAMFDIDPSHEAAGRRRTPGDYTEGLLELLKGNYSGAIAKLANAVRHYPQWLQARMSLATAYLRAGKKTQALVEFAAIAKQEPRLISPHLAMARIFLETGPLFEAFEHAHVVLSLEPRNPQALEILARAYIRSDRLTEAVVTFEKRIEAGRAYDPSLGRMLHSFEDVAEKDESLFNVNAIGMIHLARGDFDAAWRQFDRMRAIWPTAVLTDYQQARFLVQRGEHERAAKLLTRATEGLKWILERSFADSHGVVVGRLTDEQRAAALRTTPVMADLLAQLGKIALDTKDYRAALDYSNRALNCNEMHVRAALQAAEAHHIFAREHLQPVPEAIKKLTAALADPATRKLKEQRRKLLRKEQLSDKEKEEFRRLTQQVWWAREQQYAILTRCCEYAGGDLGRKPAGMGSAGPVFSAFYSALSGVHFADVELGSGASVLQRILAIERMHPLLFKTAAAVYTEYANIWTLGGRAQQLLAKEMTALHEDLKADRVRLVDKKRENGLTKEEKKTFDDLTAQTNLLVGALIRLQTQLDRARHHSRRYAELADEHRQAYLDLTAAGD